MLRPQFCNQPQNLLEQLPLNGDLGHLEGNGAAVTADLGADLRTNQGLVAVEPEGEADRTIDQSKLTVRKKGRSLYLGTER